MVNKVEKVGIVLISHSYKVAEGIKDILNQVVSDVPIELAGGTDENDIGTSMNKILAAIEQAYSEKGVILFYDLGSAMMNAEMAIELSGKDHIQIADNIPLLEGSYVAAVESGIGKDITAIMKSLKEQFRSGFA
ncbi:MAG TPA: dihydroxyacetone kinase phosphoryl donor subunit DhaM [Bacillus sp. (in: firmicutes)]|uniref:dihydroxyacetone kinase phosphoryl donor subunit DhaM n=1 Tax=Bacillus litorisediminis TaxID=2922713 RepID=UPI001FADD1B1|nr:dihydroxyacetone kinase phosphoryl donor subunit DhaM [Bacillus litorisediminis]HWO76287.1 dihydroxyacetone kinase phosphoryl donor subunit DhaM [Bacillus sp. (in: firmicutes)]